MIESLEHSVYFGVFLSLGTYAIGLVLKKKLRSPICNPLLISVLLTVLTLLGKVSGKNVQVDMTGGRLVIDVERDAAGRVADLYLTGPTNIVCKGRITDETLPPDSDTGCGPDAVLS